MTDQPRPPYAGTRYPRLVEVPAFSEFIAQGWDDVPTHPDLPEGTADAAASHRTRLSAAFAGQTLVLCAGVAQAQTEKAAPAQVAAQPAVSAQEALFLVRSTLLTLGSGMAWWARESCRLFHPGSSPAVASRTRHCSSGVGFSPVSCPRANSCSSGGSVPYGCVA